MNEKEKDILEALRIQLVSTKRVTEDDFLDVKENRKTEKCIYYLKRYEDNVISCKQHLKEFKNGKGGETKFNKRWQVIPMASLRSSAALTWNIFGDDLCCSINTNKWHLCPGEYLLEYEWQSETINGHMANLDAYLRNGDCHLFVEMKMLEPLTRLHPFKSYQQYKDSNCPKEFIKAFDTFMDTPPLHFDAFQMIKHLLAIYNYFKKTKHNGRQKVVLLNCHWEPTENYISDHIYSNRTISLKKTYEDYQETAKRFIALQEVDNVNFKSVFDGINVDLELAYCKHDELIDIVGKKSDRYLKRYEIR